MVVNVGNFCLIGCGGEWIFGFEDVEFGLFLKHLSTSRRVGDPLFRFSDWPILLLRPIVLLHPNQHWSFSVSHNRDVSLILPDTRIFLQQRLEKFSCCFDSLVTWSSVFGSKISSPITISRSCKFRTKCPSHNIRFLHCYDMESMVFEMAANADSIHSNSG